MTTFVRFYRSKEQVVNSYFNQPRMPSAETIHKQTLKYIAADFDKNGHKYAPEDRARILDLLLSPAK